MNDTMCGLKTKVCCFILILLLAASPGFGQLSVDQKVADFQALAALYAKRYAPYDWKAALLNYDLLDLGPWLPQVEATTNDLDFYEVMVNYVAALNDAHAYYTIPATFVANMNFLVDIYDGKLLVDSIDRTRLSANAFPFSVGDQLISIDGQDAQQLLDGLLRYQIAANPRSTRRWAAELLTIRPQSLMPYAADVPAVSTVVLQHPDGTQTPYQIPWTKSGLALTSVGRNTTPYPLAPQSTPVATDALSVLQNCRLPDRAVVGQGTLAPRFAASLPSTFVKRLGKSNTDPFYSGVFTAGGFSIGFIRIPTFSPSVATSALTALQSEISYFQGNTDGLIVDITGNEGGNVSFTNSVLAYLMPGRWTSIGFEVRATSEWISLTSSQLVSAQSFGASQSTIDLLQSIRDAVMTANQQQQGRSVPIPLDSLSLDRDPAKDSRGNIISYSKPLMVLMDEITASAAEQFAATIQDNARGPLFGWRTMGAGGGSVESWLAGSYSLGSAYVAESLMHRKNVVVTDDYPPAPYIENIGVRPDIQVDYMTVDNLMQNGQPFVDAFVAAIVAQLQGVN
jgi:hypothetical protein